jgi:endonuclease/exonuclease/phosphatase family metal-dependent hydrolase
VFRELGLTVSSSKPEHWYAAFERHVALGRPSNDAVSAYATKHTPDISILTWNLRASQSGHTAADRDDLLPAQLQVLLQALSRPTILCLQEVCLAMVEQLPEHGYDVLGCDLVYAEVGNAEGKLSLAQIADKMKRTKYRPAFSGFNVIAVLRTFRLNRVAGCCRSLAQVLHDYSPQRDSEGAVLERRMLSAVDLTFANQTQPLRIYNTHLHAKPGASGLNERYREMEIICEQLTRQPQPVGVTEGACAGEQLQFHCRSSHSLFFFFLLLFFLSDQRGCDRLAPRMPLALPSLRVVR